MADTDDPSTDMYPSRSSFDPAAPEFLLGEASVESSTDASGVVPVLHQHRSGSGSSMGAGGSCSSVNGRSSGSLIFGGGGEFLSKYSSPEQAPRDREKVRRRVRSEAGSGGGGGSRVGPAPDRVNVQLNSLLVHSRTVDKILQVVDAHFDHFNAVNLITALHRLATVVLATRKGALRRDARFKRLIKRLSDTLRNAEAGNLKPQDLSNVAWALTKLGLLNAVLFGHLSEHIMRTISHFEPVNLSMTLWAFARSGFLDEKLFRAAAPELKRQLPDFQPQQIANTTWAMAKSGFVDEELFVAAANLALEKLGDFQPMNYSMLLYSFALAKLPHPRLFEEVGRRCTVQALSSAMSAPHVVTNLALAFSEAGVVNPLVFDTIAQVATTTLYDFRTEQIATLAQAFARAEKKHDKLFLAMSDAVVARLLDFKQQDLHDLVSAFRSLGVSTDGIEKAVEDYKHGRGQASHSNFKPVLYAVLFVLVLTLIVWHVTRVSP